jgi:AcrR family transcriptional regulator
MESKQGTRMSAPQRREVILDAAREEFARRGYVGGRVRAIAEASGIHDAMLYRHFASKEELFDAAVAQPIEVAVRSIVERPMPPLPPTAGTEEMRERSLIFFRDLLRAMQEVGVLLGVVLFADQESATHYYRERLEPLFAQLVDLTVATSERWRHRDFDWGLLHRAIFGACWMVALDEQLGSGGPADLDKAAEQLVDILFRGIAD